MRPRPRVAAARFKRSTAHPPLISLLLVFALSLAADLPKFSHPVDVLLGTFDDDFYYYLKVAQALARQHRSSFNGFMATNGYHPLWLLVLTVFWKFTSSVRVIFLLVTGTMAFSAAATFYLAQRLALRLEVEPDHALLVAFVAAFIQHQVSYRGMETILAVPLALGLLEFVSGHPPGESKGAAFLFGLLGALTVLARIDLALLVLLLGVLFLPELLLRMRFVWAAIGALPLVLYLLANHHFFGLWLPVSGLAKELKPLGWHWPRLILIPIVKIFIIGTAVALLPSALMLWRRPVVGNGTARVAVAALAFPALLWVLLCLVSDWPLWNWYAYPFVIALPAASLIAAPLMSSPFVARGVMIFSLGAMAMLIGILADGFYHLSGVQPMPRFALQLSDFAQTHPGRYAMGDRAGVVGFLLPWPLLQLEGLMGDKSFLDHIRARDDLLEVMRGYNISYYVASDAKPDGACWLTSEPFRAGPKSAHMTARLCTPPVMTVAEPDDPDHLVERVFRVDGKKS